MKAILALTSLLAASAVNLAATHESHADTFIIFDHAANGTEIVRWTEKNVAADVCRAMAESVWNEAHRADNAARDAACLPDSPKPHFVAVVE